MYFVVEMTTEKSRLVLQQRQIDAVAQSAIFGNFYFIYE